MNTPDLIIELGFSLNLWKINWLLRSMDHWILFQILHIYVQEPAEPLSNEGEGEKMPTKFQKIFEYSSNSEYPPSGHLECK